MLEVATQLKAKHDLQLQFEEKINKLNQPPKQPEMEHNINGRPIPVSEYEAMRWYEKLLFAFTGIKRDVNF